MKNFVPFKCFALCLLVFVLSSVTANSQTIPELVFKNPTLQSGSAGQNGAKYMFANVASGLDAVLEIKGRSASNVVVNNIDLTNTGWDKALQPEVGITGTVGPNQSWWVKFHLTFYEAGTNNKKKISKFVVTGLDIDGNGGSLREWVEMDKIKSISFSSVTSLTDNLLSIVTDLLDLDNNGEDHKITGSSNDYAGIDTLATNIMATYNYEDKDQIDFYLGGKTGSSGNSNAMRMSSLWFKQFNLNPISLPVKLTDFTAVYNKTGVTLNWKTSQELSFSHYELEHSTDAKVYTTTAVVFGAGIEGMGAAYSFVDRTVNGRSGIIYYRLKMVDIDGRFTYSPVRVIRLGEEKPTMTVSVYPNPVTTDLRVTLPSSWQGKQVAIDLYNANGQKVKTLQTSNSSQTENISVADVDKGVYFLKAMCGDDTAKQTIIKK